MVRVRKLVLAIAAASALTSGMAHALGLGEVTLQSALNQPLVAEIELLEVRDLASSELIPSLAPPEEFNKAGVDRPYFLTDLKFTPVVKPGGKSVIRVTSSKPVREPYLNFLVEVLWPNGRLLREYTLLLDPPLYAPQAAPVPQAPVAAAVPRSSAPAASPAPRSSTAQSAAPRTIDGNEYTTSRSDTLWDIAERVRGGNSVHQAMLAIQDLNPDAFINNNINLLKSGQVLRLPDEQQIKSRSQSEALAQVAAQNATWRENRGLAAGARQLDATKRTAAGATPAQSESRDSLRLVSGETGKTTAGGDRGKNGDSKALADKLAVTQESLDSTRRANEELTSRVSDLQSQLDKLQRLIQLKDEQLAKLQADLAAQAKQSSEAPKAPEQPAVETPAAPAKQAATPAVQPAQTPPAEPDFNYEEPAKPDAAAAKPQQPASEPASAVKPAEKPAAAKPAQPAAKPAPVVEEPQPTSLLDDLLANPMMLGIAGGGVLLLLLIGLMVVSRRNAMKEAELQSSLAGEEEESFSSDMELPDSGFEGLETIGTETTAPVPSEERVSAQTGDALGEADIYIAYGRFSQAAELLQNAINQEPQRSDLRIKLMEVQAELGDREGFARQESELREIGGSAAQIEQLKSKYPAMTAAAAVGLAGATASDDLDSFSLDDLTLDEPVVAKPAAPAPAAGELDDAFELSLDDLEADLDRDVRAAATSDMTLDLDDLALDSDLDTPASASTAEPAASEDLDFDLELASEPAAEELGLGDDLADFSLDLESENAPAADEDEFMLSLDEEPAPAAMADEGLADLSLELPEEEVQAADLELPADFDLSLADEGLAEPETENFAAQLDQVSEELDQLSVDLDQPRAEPAAPAPAAAASMAGLESDDDFDFLSGTDESATKLDLARAYIDMGDTEGARDILDEVITEGNDSQQQEAREMLARLA